jgi:hypothetical protein
MQINHKTGAKARNIAKYFFLLSHFWVHHTAVCLPGFQSCFVYPGVILADKHKIFIRLFANQNFHATFVAQIFKPVCFENDHPIYSQRKARPQKHPL